MDIRRLVFSCYVFVIWLGKPLQSFLKDDMMMIPGRAYMGLNQNVYVIIVAICAIDGYIYIERSCSHY